VIVADRRTPTLVEISIDHHQHTYSGNGFRDYLRICVILRRRTSLVDAPRRISNIELILCNFV